MATVESAAPALATLRREPGQLVDGRYRIEQQLAEGGMGVVFRARDERSGTQVALKQLRVMANLGPESLAAIGVQFEREYHTLSQLSHPCIIDVFDYGVDEAGAYYTMELLEGQDLRQRGKLPWREACPVLRDVASALAILHSRRLLHRDVTARNVFCTSAGRSKLIDFGAMMTMGVAKHLVGTPPFVPLEALQQQSLDGRSDLYSLGALAYWVLTGTYAYSARSLAELKERFATTPPTLRQQEPEIPEALDALVMSLLQLDRDARPGSAAEVMERLSGIAGLPLHERAEVSRAYLSMPMLVGRDAALERVGADLLAGRKGAGTTVLIEGPAGSGRSRMLDACVLRAKLRGALVLRSDAADAARGPYGVARALGLQLIEALPTEAFQAGRSQRDTLAHVLPELRPGSATGPSLRPGAGAERRQLQAALRDFFLSVSRNKHIVIAVDDLDRADEPSAAMLGAMAHGARRRRLNILLTVCTGAAPTAALALIQQEAHRLPIAALSAAETEQLLRSVFGDVPHVATLAERIHEVAGGTPTATMMLAEHLVAQGIARYEAGSWALPEQLLADHLPSSTGEALLARIASLPPDARDLVEVLSLTDSETIAPELYARLSDHRDPGRTYRALEALTASGVLTLVGDRYRFAQFDAGAVIERKLEEDRKRALHARLAEVLQGSSAAERVVHHQLLGGQERVAIERIVSMFALSAASGLHATEMLQQARDAAERLGLPLRTRLELRTLMLQSAAQMGRYELFRSLADVLVKRLELDSGLFDYAQLPAEMDPDARLKEALQRVAQRQATTPPDERGFAPAEVPRNMLRVFAAFSSMSAISQDLDMVEHLPRLDPLVRQTPLISWVRSLVEIQRAHRAGYTTLALEQAVDLSERLARVTNDADGPIVIANALRVAMLYMLALFAATSGQAKARDMVSELEQVPGQRGNAWRVRMIYELMHGNVEAAAECQRRSELLNLQDGGQLQLPGTTVRTELIAHMHADELIGVKRATERIAELAEAYPGWRPTLAIARCHYRRLQGDAAGALAELEPVLQLRAGRHMDWWIVAYSHVRALSELDPAEAARVGEGYLETWAKEQLSTVDYGLGQVTADAQLRAGRVEDAQKTIDTYIATHEHAETRGLRLGLAYETRARVAIAQRDEQAVQHYTRLCAQQYKGGRHVALLNRYTRLLREADAGGIAVTTGLRFGGDVKTSASVSTSFTHSAHTIHSRLESFLSAAERTEAGLKLLLEASGADSGFLFGVREGSLVQLAPEGDAPSGLREFLDTYLRIELAGEVATTMDSRAGDEELERCFRDETGREFEPVLLTGKHLNSEVVAGIAAIHYTSARRPALLRGAIQAVTQTLIADGTVEPLTQ